MDYIGWISEARGPVVNGTVLEDCGGGRGIHFGYWIEGKGGEVLIWKIYCMFVGDSRVGRLDRATGLEYDGSGHNSYTVLHQR